jgi:hypothetical protein
MNLKSMIQPTESSTPSLMFHEKPVRHVLVRVHSKCHTCVKYLFVLQIHFPGVQADYKHHMPLRHNKNWPKLQISTSYGKITHLDFLGDLHELQPHCHATPYCRSLANVIIALLGLRPRAWFQPHCCCRWDDPDHVTSCTTRCCNCHRRLLGFTAPPRRDIIAAC